MRLRYGIPSKHKASETQASVTVTEFWWTYDTADPCPHFRKCLNTDRDRLSLCTNSPRLSVFYLSRPDRLPTEIKSMESIEHSDHDAYAAPPGICVPPALNPDG